MASVIDHLVVAAGTLEAATAHVEAALDLEMGPGVRHGPMGTHNRLLSLGPDDYLEALAPDPGAETPGRPRWFGLDAPTGGPRLAGWALRVDDLDDALERAPEGIGTVVEMWRGEHLFRVTVPETGQQPFDGLFPALISWPEERLAAALPDIGARLVSLTLSHPAAGRLGWALSMLTDDDRVTVHAGPPGLRALIHTENGERDLT